MLTETKLENVFYDGRPVEKIERVVEEGQEHSQVIVTFSDSLKPGSEIMHVEEWEAMKSEGPKQHERSYNFQQSTYSIQSRLMREIESFNPRWNEIDAVLGRIRFANDEILDLALHGIFGKAKDKATVNDVEASIRANGSEPDLGNAAGIALEILMFCKEKNYALADFQQALPHALDLMGSLQKQSIQAATGVPFSHLRLDHIIEQAEKGSTLLQSEKE